MSVEEHMISTFYTSLQRGDWKGMLNCYLTEVFFYDPVFGNLEGDKVRAMWEMLVGRAEDLSLSFDQVRGADGYGSCYWTATYTFGPTGRRVINKGKAYFTFGEGRIAEHQDEFSLWRWSAQALGLKGMLFGGTWVMQRKIREMARGKLDRFIAARNAVL
jgi:hypothetical protein